MRKIVWLLVMLFSLSLSTTVNAFESQHSIISTQVVSMSFDNPPPPDPNDPPPPPPPHRHRPHKPVPPPPPPPPPPGDDW